MFAAGCTVYHVGHVYVCVCVCVYVCGVSVCVVVPLVVDKIAVLFHSNYGDSVL